MVKHTSRPTRINSTNTAPSGAYCSQEDLIQLRFQAKNLKLLQRKKALSLLTGPNKTRFRGRGIDFEEVRKYQPGDDIRSIDWRVTARSGKPHTKLFREERERPLLIATDQRTSMFFGSQHCFKSVTAAHISALLAWSGLQNGDRVGGLIFNEIDHIETRPRRSRQTVLAQLHHISNYNGQLPLLPNDGKDFQFFQMLTDLRRITKPGTAVFIVSDFSGAEHERAQECMYQLSRHAEITAIHISDRLEAEMPPSGQYIVSDGIDKSSMFTGDNFLRNQYKNDNEKHVQLLRNQLSRLGIPFIPMKTHDSPLGVLQSFYGGLERSKKRPA